MKWQLKKVFVLGNPILGSLSLRSPGITTSSNLSLHVERNLERFFTQLLVGFDGAAQGDLHLLAQFVEECIFIVIFPDDRMVILQAFL